MATINFTDQVTVVPASWLNAVDALVYDVFNGLSTAGTSGTWLRSNGTNIINSTSTLADTFAVSRLVYASSTNTLTGLATANTATLQTDSGGIPSWVANATALTNLGGVTSSAVVLQTLADAKGDMIVASANDVWAKQTAGANNTLLGYDSSQTNGVRAFAGSGLISIASGLVTTTMTTARLLGRTTASTGVVEEITVGSGLTLSGGSLTASASGITMGTPVVTTSGTSIDFTGIPSGTKRISISFKGVSTSGTDNWLIQLGDAGGIETSGYLGSGAQDATSANYTAGFGLNIANAGAVIHGTMVLTLENSSNFTWTCAGNVGRSDTNAMHVTGGSKSTSQELDRVRITTTGGSQTFDAGEINIQYQ